MSYNFSEFIALWMMLSIIVLLITVIFCFSTGKEMTKTSKYITSLICLPLVLLFLTLIPIFNTLTEFILEDILND